MCDFLFLLGNTSGLGKDSSTSPVCPLPKEGLKWG